MEKEIITPEESVAIFNEIGDKLKRYMELGSEKEIAFKIRDKKIEAMFRDKIAPYTKELEPLTEEMLTLEKERETIEKTAKEHIAKMEEVKGKIDKIVLKRNKFITRISPMIIRDLGSQINKYQQFGSIIEKDGSVYVTVKDWLSSFMAGFEKKAEAQKEKVNKKISPKMQTAE